MNPAKHSPLGLLLVSAALCFGGCASKTPAFFTQSPNAEDRAKYIEDRATQLISRGAPRDKAVAAASGEWDNRMLPAETRARAEQRAAQQQFVADLEKMQRTGR